MSVLILVVVAISIVWAFNSGESEGYVFSFTNGTAEDGSSVSVLRLERGWRDRKFVAASPVNENIRSEYRVPEKRVSLF